ncbi:MAG TPA: hypothetical protein VIY29_05205 [Ktedonobacteraceae bacterium]
MMSAASRESPVTVVQEIDLGAHYLFIMSDLSIEVLADEQASSGVEHVLSLDSCEAYRLMISLQEAFKQGTDQSRVAEGLPGASWHPSQGGRR